MVSPRMCAGLHVDAEGVRTRSDEVVHVLVGALDHEVHREEPSTLVHRRRHRPEHGGTDGEIGDEVAVHDVDMDHPHSGIHDPGDLFAQAGEIGREDGG